MASALSLLVLKNLHQEPLFYYHLGCVYGSATHEGVVCGALRYDKTVACRAMRRGSGRTASDAVEWQFQHVPLELSREQTVQKTWEYPKENDWAAARAAPCGRRKERLAAPAPLHRYFRCCLLEKGLKRVEEAKRLKYWSMQPS